MATRAFYRSILAHFPQSGLRLAFAYGSGVFQQVGHQDIKKNMVDFIFVVDNQSKWHKENIKRNRKHYSFLRYLGPDYISWIQNDFGANIYFNTLVPCEGRIIKYGVISTKSMVKDLIEWETLYVSGRLQKPVYHIVEAGGRELKAALEQNHKSAVHTALLMLSDQFTEEEFFQTITGLSYTGDFRMTVGEDRNKIKNIVKPNVEKFRGIYGQFLESDEYTHWHVEDGLIEQSLCSASRYYHLSQLPLNVQYSLTTQRNVDRRHRDTEEVIRSCARHMEYDQMLKNAITDIVKSSSRTQSLKGILTAGLYKSMKYSGKKLSKMYKSQR